MGRHTRTLTPSRTFYRWSPLRLRWIEIGAPSAPRSGLWEIPKWIFWIALIIYFATR